MPNGFDILRQCAAMVCFAVAVALTGCGGPPVPATDYRIQHPIAAQEKVFSLIVPVSASGRVTADANAHKIREFAADYLRRGRGPLLVSQSGVASSGAHRSMISGLLAEAGVPRQMVYFQERAANKPGGNTTEFSFSGYGVRVPVCGDWSGQAGFDPSNRSHTDFGCSYQRNTGLMLSNPGDLSVAGDHLERDARASDRVIRTYRDGKQMGTQAPTLEQKDFSDLVKK